MTKMTYIQYLNLRFMSAIKFIWSDIDIESMYADIESMYNQLMEMIGSIFKKLSIDQVL